MYGIYYDDTAYDYMQHMREIGDSVEGVFIEAPQEQKGKGKGKQQSLADALRETSAEDLIPKELRASETVIKRSYQDQQDVPDALAGFQPDMDPRLREVLEALEDEAYVDDDEDIFEQLAEGGEATAREFEDAFFEEEDEEGWESDATAKPGSHQKPAVTLVAGTEEAGKAAPVEGDAWMHEFSKFKKAEKRMKKPVDDASSLADTMSFGGSSLGGTMSMSGRTRRRHKKAGTESSGYSMTSSSLFRTEGLTTLDARFDKVVDPPHVESNSRLLTRHRSKRNTPTTTTKMKSPHSMARSRRHGRTSTPSWTSSWTGTTLSGEQIGSGRERP